MNKRVHKSLYLSTSSSSSWFFFAPFYFHEYIKANNIIRFLRQSAILGHVLYLCMHLIGTTQVHWHCITNQNWCPHGIPEPQTSHVCNQLLIKYDFYIKKIAILFVICDPICRERPISINNIINLMYRDDKYIDI